MSDVVETLKALTDDPDTKVRLVRLEDIHTCIDEITRLRAENVRLREALEPFAEAADAMLMNDRYHCPDDFEVIHEHGNELVRLDRGHFRAASTALTEGQSNG